MSHSGKVSRTFELIRIFRAAEKIQAKSLRAAEKRQGVAEKNKEKVEANSTGSSADFFGSQSVEMFCFTRKTKLQI